MFETYNLSPKESFFIDDKKLNIETGKSLGMNGYILDFESYGVSELIKVMKENDIKL